MVVQTKANIAATTHSVESSPENLDTYVVCPGEECTNEKRGAEQASPMQPSCLLSPAKEEAVGKELETHIRDPSHQPPRKSKRCTPTQPPFPSCTHKRHPRTITSYPAPYGSN